MPTFMTERIARSLYKSRHLDVTYSPRFFINDYPFGRRTDWVMQFVEIPQISSALVVGCGYGALIKELHDRYLSDTYGLDPGPWIWENLQEWQDPYVRSMMGNDWVGSGTEKETLEGLGWTHRDATFTYVIDEDAAPAHDDDELPHFMSSLEERLQGNNHARIIHIVSPLLETHGYGDSSQNWKTIEEWKEVAPAHLWIDANSGLVF